MVKETAWLRTWPKKTNEGRKSNRWRTEAATLDADVDGAKISADGHVCSRLETPRYRGFTSGTEIVCFLQLMHTCAFLTYAGSRTMYIYRGTEVQVCTLLQIDRGLVVHIPYTRIWHYQRGEFLTNPQICG